MYISIADEWAHLHELQARAAEEAAYAAYCDREQQKVYEAQMGAAWFRHVSREWYRKEQG